MPRFLGPKKSAVKEGISARPPPYCQKAIPTAMNRKKTLLAPMMEGIRNRQTAEMMQFRA